MKIFDEILYRFIIKFKKIKQTFLLKINKMMIMKSAGSVGDKLNIKGSVIGVNKNILMLIL